MHKEVDLFKYESFRVNKSKCAVRSFGIVKEARPIKSTSCKMYKSFNYRFLDKARSQLFLQHQKLWSKVELARQKTLSTLN